MSMIVCPIPCFTFDPASLFYRQIGHCFHESRHSKSLSRATYKVIVHPSSIYSQKTLILLGESNQGPKWSESSDIIANPRSYLIMKIPKLPKLESTLANLT